MLQPSQGIKPAWPLEGFQTHRQTPSNRHMINRQQQRGMVPRATMNSKKQATNPRQTVVHVVSGTANINSPVGTQNNGPVSIVSVGEGGAQNIGQSVTSGSRANNIGPSGTSRSRVRNIGLSGTSGSRGHNIEQSGTSRSRVRNIGLSGTSGARVSGNRRNHQGGRRLIGRRRFPISINQVTGNSNNIPQAARMFENKGRSMRRNPSHIVINQMAGGSMNPIRRGNMLPNRQTDIRTWRFNNRQQPGIRNQISQNQPLISNRQIRQRFNVNSPRVRTITSQGQNSLTSSSDIPAAVINALALRKVQSDTAARRRLRNKLLAQGKQDTSSTLRTLNAISPSNSIGGSSNIGIINASPNSGRANVSPNSGITNASPNSGRTNVSPNSGINNASPNSGRTNASPNSGILASGSVANDPNQQRQTTNIQRLGGQQNQRGNTVGSDQNIGRILQNNNVVTYFPNGLNNQGIDILNNGIGSAQNLGLKNSQQSQQGINNQGLDILNNGIGSAQNIGLKNSQQSQQGINNQGLDILNYGIGSAQNIGLKHSQQSTRSNNELLNPKTTLKSVTNNNNINSNIARETQLTSNKNINSNIDRETQLALREFYSNPFGMIDTNIQHGNKRPSASLRARDQSSQPMVKSSPIHNQHTKGVLSRFSTNGNEIPMDFHVSRDSMLALIEKALVSITDTSQPPKTTETIPFPKGSHQTGQHTNRQIGREQTAENTNGQIGNTQTERNINQQRGGQQGHSSISTAINGQIISRQGPIPTSTAMNRHPWMDPTYIDVTTTHLPSTNRLAHVSLIEKRNQGGKQEGNQGVSTVFNAVTVGKAGPGIPISGFGNAQGDKGTKNANNKLPLKKLQDATGRFGSSDVYVDKPNNVRRSTTEGGTVPVDPSAYGKPVIIEAANDLNVAFSFNNQGDPIISLQNRPSLTSGSGQIRLDNRALEMSLANANA